MSFDRIAAHFRRLEKLVFHQRMQRCRTAFLRELPRVGKIALVGEGNGEFLQELLHHAEFETIHYIDSSKVMLEIARQRVQRFSKVTDPQVKFYHCDLLQDPLPDRGYDLVVTNFFLDLFNQQTLDECINKIAEASTKDAVWLYADFQIAGSRFQKTRAKSWLKIMYLFFRFVSRIQAHELIDPAEQISRKGFELVGRREFDRGLMRAEIRQRSLAEQLRTKSTQTISSKRQNRLCRPAGK